MARILSLLLIVGLGLVTFFSLITLTKAINIKELWGSKISASKGE